MGRVLLFPGQHRTGFRISGPAVAGEAGDEFAAVFLLWVCHIVDDETDGTVLRVAFANVQRHDVGCSHENASLLKKKTACFHRPPRVLLFYHLHPEGTQNHLQKPLAPVWKESAFPTALASGGRAAQVLQICAA